jgi:hypothetical protein
VGGLFFGKVALRIPNISLVQLLLQTSRFESHSFDNFDF